jgi:glycerol-3-phosphate dehydrogenase (NAD(P)+)
VKQNINQEKKVCVLAEGAWGTAIAQLLADNGCSVTLWGHDKQVVDAIRKTGYNERYLPGVQLHKSITVTADIGEALQDARFVFQATPVQFLREVLVRARPYLEKDQIWVALNKGIERESLLLPTDIIKDVLGHDTHVAVLAGPSFAAELATRSITAVTIAAPSCELGYELQLLLANDYFRPYVSTDMIGVQLGAALKNVIALGMGMLEGAGHANNARAFLFTRSLAEMAQLVVAMGGNRDTVYGLSGVGDLMLTAMSPLSKNMAVGKRLGAGQELAAIIRDTGYIPEGINTVQSAQLLIERYGVALPICSGIHDVIFGSLTLDAFLASLMRHPLSLECS